MAVLFPAADLVDPVYPADPADTPGPADTPDPADTPGDVTVADPAEGAEPVGACWLRWKAAGAAGAAGGSGEVAMVSVGDDQESRSSIQREAVVGSCRSVSGIVF